MNSLVSKESMNTKEKKESFTKKYD